MNIHHSIIPEPAGYTCLKKPNNFRREISVRQLRQLTIFDTIKCLAGIQKNIVRWTIIVDIKGNDFQNHDTHCPRSLQLKVKLKLQVARFKVLAIADQNNNMHAAIFGSAHAHRIISRQVYIYRPYLKNAFTNQSESSSSPWSSWMSAINGESHVVGSCITGLHDTEDVR